MEGQKLILSYSAFLIDSVKAAELPADELATRGQSRCVVVLHGLFLVPSSRWSAGPDTSVQIDFFPELRKKPRSFCGTTGLCCHSERTPMDSLFT